MNINELTKEIHENAKNHGWWDKPRSFGEVIALCHSELSEALEEDRAGRPMVYYNCDGHVCDELMCHKCEFAGERNDKPEGIATEMADCIIRILDWCGHENIDIESVILAKHEYNKIRPYKHGKKY